MRHVYGLHPPTSNIKVVSEAYDKESEGHFTFLHGKLPTYPSPKPTFCPK